MSLTTLYGSHLIDHDKMPDVPLIVDAGSCEGKVRSELLSTYPEAIYLSLDPREGLPALAAVSGERDFWILHGLPEWGNLYGNHLDTDHHKFERSEKIRVETMGINTIGSDIDYLKMDIEGAEFEVIEAMETAIAKQVSIEVHGDPAPIVIKLRSLGYKTRMIGEELYGYL